MEILVGEEEREWSCREESEKKAIVFRVKGKQGRVYLVKDGWYMGTWDIHFRDVSEEEIDFMFDTILEYIKPGEYLATCGPSIEWWYKKFTCRILYFRDTGMIRRAGDSYYPILKRL